MKWLYFVICAALLSGCYSEDDIIPTEGGEKFYTLPQGNHDYDNKILEYYNKYGFYILYEFTEEELYWNNTTWDQSFMGTDNFVSNDYSGDKLGKPADPDYVGDLLDLCEKGFFTIYPDNLLNEMPMKILLCSEFWSVYSNGVLKDENGNYVKDENDRYVTNYDTTRIEAYCSFNRLVVNGANAEIKSSSDSSKWAIQAELNHLFLQYLFEEEQLEVCEEFTTISSYAYAYLLGEKLFERGFVGNYLVNKNIEQSKENDFVGYLRLVTMPLEWLEAEPEEIGRDYDSQATPPLKGALNPKRDVNNLVRQKYEILINYFRDEYGIDVKKWQYPDL